MSSNIRESAGGQDAGPAEVRVWDPVMRIGHWSLVLLFFVAYVTEGELLTVHSWAGYLVGAYLVIRVVWGVVGTQHARFVDFAYGPRVALDYLRKLIELRSRRYVGHSPAGAAMVFMLLVSLAGTVGTGTALLAVKENAGPLAPWLGTPTAAIEQPVVASAPRVGGVSLLVAPARADEGSYGEAEEHDGERSDRRGGWLGDVHSFFANLTLILVLTHIAGVLFASFAHRENLIRAMVTGFKRKGPSDHA